MIESSWAASATAPFLYTPEYLRTSFEYPGADLSFAPTVYEGADPVAFVAGFPRRISVDGKTCNILVFALLTAAAAHRNRGYGIVIWSELVRRARAAGFDGMVNYCVEGEAMNRMIVGSCRRLRLPVERVYSVSYLTKILRPSGSAVDQEPDAAAATLLEAAASLPEEGALVRRWTPPEANWQCSRAGAVSSTLTGEPCGGVLTGYVLQVANAKRTKCLVVDDVLWGGLPEPDQEVLVRRLVDDAAAAGAQIAVVPQQGYADLGAFTAVGFRPSSRVVHTYLTLWNGTETPSRVSSCYLDVF
jgi:hypothetical protein